MGAAPEATWVDDGLTNGLLNNVLRSGHFSLTPSAVGVRDPGANGSNIGELLTVAGQALVEPEALAPRLLAAGCTEPWPLFQGAHIGLWCSRKLSVA